MCRGAWGIDRRENPVRLCSRTRSTSGTAPDSSTECINCSGTLNRLAASIDRHGIGRTCSTAFRKIIILIISIEADDAEMSEERRGAPSNEISSSFRVRCSNTAPCLSVHQYRCSLAHAQSGDASVRRDRSREGQGHRRVGWLCQGLLDHEPIERPNPHPRLHPCVAY